MREKRLKYNGNAIRELKRRIGVKSGAGFTLIELLVVIAIIGILAGILFANFVGVRQRARDAQRKSDLRQIQSALEMHRADQGTYPLPSLLAPCYIGCLKPNCPPPPSTPTYFGDPLCTVTYLQKIPTDPNGSSWFISGNYYYMSPNGNTYTLMACLENANDPQLTNDIPSSSCSIYTGVSKSFILRNP